MRQTSCKLTCHIEKCIHIGHLSNHGKIVMSKGLARGGDPLVFLSACRKAHHEEASRGFKLDK